MEKLTSTMYDMMDSKDSSTSHLIEARVGRAAFGEWDLEWESGCAWGGVQGGGVRVIWQACKQQV